MLTNPIPAAGLRTPDLEFDLRERGNLADLDRGLAEAARVIKPGGRLVILECTTPSCQPLRGAYLLYFRRVLPFIGRLVSRHPDAYSYLPESVLSFPEPAQLAARMAVQGFSAVRWQLLLGGICAIHVGTRR